MTDQVFTGTNDNSDLPRVLRDSGSLTLRMPTPSPIGHPERHVDAGGGRLPGSPPLLLRAGQDGEDPEDRCSGGGSGGDSRALPGQEL